jgi:hypothetical protein
VSDAWFSTMVRLLTTVDGVGPTTYTRSVFVFKAGDWDEARRQAIELGRRAEASYDNADGQHVSRQLLYVETLDMLGDEIQDGREVYSEPVEVTGDLETALPTIRPEQSRPTQSGV